MSMTTRAQRLSREVTVEQYLDTDGLLYLWEKIKATFVEKGSDPGNTVAWNDITGKPDLVLQSVYDAFVSETNDRTGPLKEAEARNAANIDYLSMMTDIALPGGENDAQPEV